MNKPAVLVIGNLVDGYKFYGPFNDADLASEYANLHNIKNAFVVELEKPEVALSNNKNSILL